MREEKMLDSPLHSVDIVASLDNVGRSSSCWHFCSEHVEQCSSCREDGISLACESTLRKSYCAFIQKLGRQLKLPQVTIATAIIFCHRFFLRQSLARNDIYIIATVCIFLAGKVEETPERLQNAIVSSYELRNVENPGASSIIKEKDVFEKEKELLLMGERLVLITLGFNLNVAHPYKPLISAIKRLPLPPTVPQSQLAQIAWNFVNDGLQTLLCVQFKPYHVAAGALFLAAKFLRVKILDWEEVLSKEFDISLQQLEDVSNQILQSYDPAMDVSASSSRSNKLVRVDVTHCQKQASTESCTFSIDDLRKTSPIGICKENTEWPPSPGRPTMEEKTGNMILQKTPKAQIARFDVESATCHTGHSDITDEREPQDGGRGYFLEEDYLGLKTVQPCEDFDNDCDSPSPIGSDECHINRPWLVTGEMKLRRDRRNSSPDTNWISDSLPSVSSYNSCVWPSTRHSGIRQSLCGTLFTTKRYPRKTVARSAELLPARNKIEPTRRGLTTPDRQNRRLENRLKLLRQKDEILKKHCSWSTREYCLK